MADINHNTVEEDEESEYSYVYETDSEYEYYTESEEDAADDNEVVASNIVIPSRENNDSVTNHDANSVSESNNNNNEDDYEEEEEDENEALNRHKQQLEKFKPKVPAYVTDPEPCAFSDDPSAWIAWMEAQVNKEKTRRMEIIMQESVTEDDDKQDSKECSPATDSEQVSPSCDDSMGDNDDATNIQKEVADDNPICPEDTQIDVQDNNNCDQKIEEDEGSEWEWESEDEAGAEVEATEVDTSINLKQASEEKDVADENNVTEEYIDDHLSADAETRPEEGVSPAEVVEVESGELQEKASNRLTYDKQMSLPAENRRRELVPLEMQEKINFIRKKKAEAACASGQASDVAVTSSVMGENPTNTTDSTKAVSNSILDEDTKRKLAFIKEQKKKGISKNDLDKPDDGFKHDPNDPLDPETRRKLDFVRKNKKNSAPENTSISSTSPTQQKAFLRQQSMPEGSSKTGGGRPNSFAEQYGDDSNLNDMLARIKTLRAERKQILQDMNAIKTAFSEEPSKSCTTSRSGQHADSADGDKLDTTDDGIETGESTPCTEINPPFKDGKNSPLTCPPSLLSRQARRSIDSGIGTKSLCSVPSGSPTEELDAISENNSVMGSEHPARKKISKEEKEHSEGVFYCFICGENLGKMTKGTVMHMGLEDGEPVCPEALYLTDESKEKIMSIASTRMFSYEDKYGLLDTMELETWDLEYDIPTGDLMDKVDAFLQDVEVQKKKDAEKFEAMRNGAIDEIFMEEFKDLLSEKCKQALMPSLSDKHDHATASGHQNNECDNSGENDPEAMRQNVNIASSRVGPPAPPPPPPPAPPSETTSSSSNIPPNPAPAFNNVLQSIRENNHQKLKPTEINNHSEIEVGQVIHKHIAPRVFTKDVRNLVKDITKDDHKQRLKKVKTRDKSAPFIPADVEIYFYGGQNANKSLPPPPLSTKIKEEYNSSKKR